MYPLMIYLGRCDCGKFIYLYMLRYLEDISKELNA
jgi:hypothetical protein